MWLCTVLSLSQYLFCYFDEVKGDVQLFEVKPQYTRYVTQLMQLVKKLDTQLKRLGFEEGYIGYQSGCKGVSTMGASGCTLYPPIVTLCIQGGWD